LSSRTPAGCFFGREIQQHLTAAWLAAHEAGKIKIDDQEVVVGSHAACPVLDRRELDGDKSSANLEEIKASAPRAASRPWATTIASTTTSAP
jgi:hypothetical protein